MSFHNRPKPSQNSHKVHGLVSPFFRLPSEKTNKPIIGWRTWRLTCSCMETAIDKNQNMLVHREDCEWMLKAGHLDVIWESPVMTTIVAGNGKPVEVSLTNHKRNGERGDYGVYSYKTLNWLLEFHGSSGVIGRIDNYGHVIEHEFGYRSQKVVIKELWVVAPFSSLIAEQLEKRYHCPLTIVRNYKGDINV
jgi:hypothetical protein